MNSEKNIIKNKLQGLVTKCGNKTITIEVRKKVKHLLYGKFINKIYKYKAHDPNNKCKINDNVIIKYSRPHSCTKRWNVFQIL